MTFPYKGFILSWLLRHWQKSSGKAELKNELLRHRYAVNTAGSSVLTENKSILKRKEKKKKKSI